MKIAFDTNVLISGFLTTTGPSQHVLTAALKHHVVILSEYIIEEFERKLIQKIKMPREPVTKALTFLRKRAVILDIKENPKIDFSDKKDIPILSLLEASKANYFVTGEKKLLSLKKFGPTLFLTPREAMEILEEN